MEHKFTEATGRYRLAGGQAGGARGARIQCEWKGGEFDGIGEEPEVDGVTDDDGATDNGLNGASTSVFTLQVPGARVQDAELGGSPGSPFHSLAFEAAPGAGSHSFFALLVTREVLSHDMTLLLFPILTT